MNHVYEAKYSKVKKIIGAIPVGEVKQVRVPGEDAIKVILRHNKKMVTIQHMSMNAYWQEMEEGGVSSEKIGWVKDAMAASEAAATLTY
jgi:hypothetical protein